MGQKLDNTSSSIIYYSKTLRRRIILLNVIDSMTIDLQKIRLRQYKFAKNVADIISECRSKRRSSTMLNIDKSAVQNDPWIQEFKNAQYRDPFYYGNISSFDDENMKKLHDFINSWNEKYGINMCIFSHVSSPEETDTSIVYPTNIVSTQLVPSDVVEQLDLSTTDINEGYIKDKEIFVNHHIYFKIVLSYDENDPYYKEEVYFNTRSHDAKIFTFNIGNLPDINLPSYDSVTLGKHVFSDVADKIQEHSSIPAEGDITVAGFFDKDALVIHLYLLQAEDVQYDIVYAFFIGHGQDGGFGDYTSPMFTHPYIDNGRVVYVETLEEANKVKDHLNDVWSSRFYDENHEMYSGEFPLEANIIPLTLPKDSSHSSMCFDDAISIMKNSDINENYDEDYYP